MANDESAPDQQPAGYYIGAGILLAQHFPRFSPTRSWQRPCLLSVTLSVARLVSVPGHSRPAQEAAEQRSIDRGVI